jgi:hypothetical protein
VRHKEGRIVLLELACHARSRIEELPCYGRSSFDIGGRRPAEHVVEELRREAIAWTNGSHVLRRNAFALSDVLDHEQ